MSYQGAYDKIIGVLEKELPPLLTYHNVQHAKRVLASINDHLDTLELDPRKEELIRLAGIGHDIGFIESFENHELIGIQLLKPIFQEEGYTESEIHEISTMIWATRIDMKARTFMEKILVDADLEYLGGDDFDQILQDLFQEWVNFERIPDDYPLFLENSLKFMEEHRFETDYAKAYNNKARNIEELKIKLDEIAS